MTTNMMVTIGLVALVALGYLGWRIAIAAAILCSVLDESDDE